MNVLSISAPEKLMLDVASRSPATERERLAVMPLADLFARSPFSIVSAELRPGHGGIAHVARLMVKSLFFAQTARCVTLTECPSRDLFGIKVSAARGSRAQFAALLARELLTRRPLIYDFAGLARLHPRHLVSYACWMHGIEAWEGASLARIPVMRRADLLLANSHYTVARARRGFGEFGNAKVCWLGTDTDDPVPRSPIVEGRPTLLTLGRIDDAAYKGHDAILDVWKNVVARVPGARWVVAGGGPALENFRRRASMSPAHDTIEIRGFVTNDDVPLLWHEATAFAMPSRGEGFGLVYIDAMRHGVPVIASTHDAGQEINVHGETGFNVDLTRAGQLEECIVQLLTNRDEGERMGDEAVRRWQRHFSFTAFQNRFCQIAAAYAAS